MILGTRSWQLDVATPRDGVGPFSRALACLALLALAPAPASAQQTQTQTSTQTLSQTLNFLMTNQSTPIPEPLDSQAAALTSDTIADSLLVGLATLPIGSSASGFHYRVDRQRWGA